MRKKVQCWDDFGRIVTYFSFLETDEEIEDEAFQIWYDRLKTQPTIHRVLELNPGVWEVTFKEEEPVIVSISIKETYDYRPSNPSKLDETLWWTSREKGFTDDLEFKELAKEVWKEFILEEFYDRWEIQRGLWRAYSRCGIKKVPHHTEINKFFHVIHDCSFSMTRLYFISTRARCGLNREYETV